MNEPLKVYTLGQLSICIRDQPVGGFISRKAEALVVYLAYTGQMQLREFLGEFLWPERTQERAASNLRTIISNLRQQLGTWLTISRHTIGINPQANLWLDVIELERVLKVAQHRWAHYGNLSDSVAEQLAQALTLYRGDFLDGVHIRDAVGFENWQLQLRENLRLQTLLAFKQLTERALQLRQWSNGITYARRILELDPLLEDAHALLIQLLASSGQHEAALNQVQQCIKIFRQELHTAPSPALTELYESIQSGKFEVSNTAEINKTAPRMVPLSTTPFVKREAEFDQIMEILPQIRLLTLVGHGGIGKTRLALEVAAQISGFPDGVFFISLNTLNGDTVVSHIAEMLGISLKGAETLQTQLLTYLRDKAMLLILDNFEHLIPDSIPLITDILEHAPQVRLLVTSRERMNLRGEVPLLIDRMPYPSIEDANAAPEKLAHYSSIQLLLQCIQRIQPQFVPQQADWVAMARICQLVDGIPLGLELAASWIQTLTLSEIAAEIQTNLGFLESSFRDLPERHRSIQNVLESTWNHLTEAEQRAFRQMAIFRGGFTREAAGVVGGASTSILHLLISKALLRRDSAGRYTAHELLRQYAAQKLRDSGQFDQVAAQHSVYYAHVLEALERRQGGKTSRLMVDEIALDIENFRQSWEYMLDVANQTQIIQCARVLFIFYEFQGRYREGCDLFGAAQARLNRHVERVALAAAYVALYQSIFHKNMGQYEAAETLLRGCLHVLEAQATTGDVLLALHTLASMAYARGDYARSNELHEHLLKINRREGDETGIAGDLMSLGDLATVMGQYEKGYRLISEGLALYRQLGSQWGIASALAALGDVANKLGQYAPAFQAFEESLAICKVTGERRGAGVALVNLGRVARAQGRYTEAITFCKESLEICLETGNRWGCAFAHLQLGRAFVAEGNLFAAQAQFMDALTLARAVGSKWIEAFTLGELSAWNSQQGFRQEARTNLIAALKLAQIVDATPLTLHLLRLAGIQMEQALQIRLLALVYEHPSTEYETRTEAAQLLASLDQTTLAYTDAYQAGQALTLDAALDLIFNLPE